MARERTDLAAEITRYVTSIENECDVKLILRYLTIPGALPNEGLQCAAVAVVYGPNGAPHPLESVSKRSATSSSYVVQQTMMRCLTAVLGSLLTRRAVTEMDVRGCGFGGLNSLD